MDLSFPGGAWRDWEAMVKDLITNAGDTRDKASIPGSGGSLEKEMATLSSILASKIPWMEELGKLQFTGLHRVRRD